MPLFEMDAVKWWALCWIVSGLGVLWCGAALWWKYRKATKDEAGGSPKD